MMIDEFLFKAMCVLVAAFFVCLVESLFGVMGWAL